MNGIGSIAAALLRLVLPDDDLHRASGMEGDGRARRLLGAERRRSSTIICLTGTRRRTSPGPCPIDAGMAIVLWIGIVISAQAFQATPREHAPAVVSACCPGIGAWGALMAKNGLRAAGVGIAGGPPFSAALIADFRGATPGSTARSRSSRASSSRP